MTVVLDFSSQKILVPMSVVVEGVGFVKVLDERESRQLRIGQ